MGMKQILLDSVYKYNKLNERLFNNKGREIARPLFCYKLFDYLSVRNSNAIVVTPSIS